MAHDWKACLTKTFVTIILVVTVIGIDTGNMKLMVKPIMVLYWWNKCTQDERTFMGWQNMSGMITAERRKLLGLCISAQSSSICTSKPVQKVGGRQGVVEQSEEGRNRVEMG